MFIRYTLGMAKGPLILCRALGLFPLGKKAFDDTPLSLARKTQILSQDGIHFYRARGWFHSLLGSFLSGPKLAF